MRGRRGGDSSAADVLVTRIEGGWSIMGSAITIAMNSQKVQ